MKRQRPELLAYLKARRAHAATFATAAFFTKAARCFSFASTLISLSVSTTDATASFGDVFGGGGLKGVIMSGYLRTLSYSTSMFWTASSSILEVDLVHSLLLRGLGSDAKYEFRDVGTEKRRRGGCEPRRQVGVPDDCDPVCGGYHLVRHGLRNVPPVGGSKVDDDAPGLHDVEHLLGDKHGRLATGDEGHGDDDVDVGGLLEHQTRWQVGASDVISGGLTWIIVSEFPMLPVEAYCGNSTKS